MFIRLLVLFISAFLGTGTETFGQHLIHGRILDPYLTPIPGIGIYTRDTVPLANTDMEGYFELKDAPKDLLVAGIGYQWTKISINQPCEALELILPEEGNYDYRSHRRLDRIRLRAFNRIHQTHLQAYQHGLFKTPLPCYARQFESWSAYTDATLESECSYRCIILNKNRRKGWNLSCQTLPDSLSARAPTRNGLVLKPGEVIEHNMKYFAILKH